MEITKAVWYDDMYQEMTQKRIALFYTLSFILFIINKLKRAGRFWSHHTALVGRAFPVERSRVSGAAKGKWQTAPLKWNWKACAGFTLWTSLHWRWRLLRLFHDKLLYYDPFFCALYFNTPNLVQEDPNMSSGLGLDILMFVTDVLLCASRCGGRRMGEIPTHQK